MKKLTQGITTPASSSSSTLDPDGPIVGLHPAREPDRRRVDAGNTRSTSPGRRFVEAGLCSARDSVGTSVPHEP